MLDVIVIENDSRLNAMYSLNLQLWLNCKVKSFKEAKFAIEYLRNSSTQFSLVVTKRSSNLEKSSLAIKNFIKTENLDLPVIVLGEKTIVNAKESTVEHTDITKLIQVAGELLKITAKKMARLEVPEFYPIDIKNIGFIEELPTPLYQKIHGNYEIVCTEMLSSQKLQELKGSSDDTVYVKREKRLIFVIFVTDHFLKRYKAQELGEAS